MRDIAFVDIDTQRDFIDPEGALCVEGAEEIVPNLKKLVDISREKEVWLLSSIDAHPADDGEFEHFPPHCVEGSEGQSKIAETIRPPYIVIKTRPDVLPVEITPETQVIFEKQDFDIFSNSHFIRFVQDKGITRFVVFGVATDYCVCAAALGLRKRGRDVTVVEDAIRAVDAGSGKESLEEMRRAGVKISTTDGIIAEIF